MKQRAKQIIRFLDTNGRILYGEKLNKEKNIANTIKDNNLFGCLELTDEKVKIKEVLAPIIPTQILCIGLNYQKHAIETGKKIPDEPILFMKSIGSVVGPDKSIILPKSTLNKPEVDYECELAVILGKSCTNLSSKEEAINYILGYTIANDISARRWQGIKGGGQYCRAKSFNTFCPLGPSIVTKEIITDPQNLELSLKLNNKIMQKSTTADMIFNVFELIYRLSQDTTLPAGTVLLTGTPEGVGVARSPPVFLKDGDKIESIIEKIGTLNNNVIHP